MGEQERASRQRTKRNQLQRIVLQSVKVAGVLSVALVAPNVIGAMGKLGLLPSPRQKAVVGRAVDRLVAARSLRWSDSKITLTEKGEHQLRLLLAREAIAERPKRWDKKWRILIFDIPERRRSMRIRLRIVLAEIGFVRLQDSVWAYPYDCEDLVMLLKAEYRVGDDVRYIIADSIERDAQLRRHFGLR